MNCPASGDHAEHSEYDSVDSDYIYGDDTNNYQDETLPGHAFGEHPGAQNVQYENNPEEAKADQEYDAVEGNVEHREGEGGGAVLLENEENIREENHQNTYGHAVPEGHESDYEQDLPNFEVSDTNYDQSYPDGAHYEENVHDQNADFSIRNDHYENMPVPGIDYPAKETFAVDSPLNENNRERQGNEEIYQNSRERQEEYIPESENAEHTYEDIRKTPSQRIRDRANAFNNRRRQPSSPSNRRTRPTPQEDQPLEDLHTTEVTEQKITRAPPKLENFQSRFRQWRDRRRPQLSGEYDKFRTSTTSSPRRVTNRPYELIRRRAQTTSTETPRTVDAEQNSLGLLLN